MAKSLLRKTASDLLAAALVLRMAVLVGDPWALDYRINRTHSVPFNIGDLHPQDHSTDSTVSCNGFLIGQHVQATEWHSQILTRV